MSKSGNSITYSYNADGKRISKTVNGTTYNYAYLGDQLTEMTWGSNKLHFTYDSIGPASVTYNGVKYFYLKNAQGDVTGLVNASGTQVVSYAYDPWGAPMSTDGTMASTLGAANPLRYRGYVYDTETGLYYLSSRYYNPVWGRFINADTADVVATSPDKTHWDKNLFAYCDDNPVNRRDDGGDLWEYVVGKMIVGTVVGGLTGGISSMLDDAAAGKEVSLASFAKGFFSGMLSGAVSTAASLVMEGLVPLISILRAPKDAERAIRMAEVVASAICATISAIRNRESLPDALLSIGSAAAAAYISNRVSPSGHSAGAIIGGGITSFAVGGAVSSAKTAIHISINSSRNRGPERRMTV